MEFPKDPILVHYYFLLLINKLHLPLHDFPYCVDLYSDDTTIYDQQFDISTLPRNLQQKPLELLHDWYRKNGVVMNTLKTVAMLISTTQKKNNLQEDALALKYND